MEDIKRMQIGEIVDFCIAYNKRKKEELGESKPKKRLATQREIDAYFG